MRIYSEMPTHLVKDWVHSFENGEGHVPFHYHNVEEWLQVREGKITFISADGTEYPLDAGKAFHIPRGEVHEVEIGGNVSYDMWIPMKVSDQDWEQALTDSDIALIRRNLAVPQREDLGDAKFFEEFLAASLMFRAANGQVLDKQGFLQRGFANRRRKASASVVVLHKSAQDMLLSNIVTLPGPNGPLSFTNVRLMALENGAWKCRVWINYPEPGARESAEAGKVASTGKY